MQAGKQPQQVQGRGSAPATEDGRKNLMRVWNLGVAAGMINKAGKWEDEWDPCEQELWQEVATWLVYGYQFDYTPPRSKHTIKKNYAPTTALEAFTGMINLAKNHKFLYDQRARDWFECTDEPKQGESRSALQHWYHSLKDQVFDQAYNRATKAGDLKDASSKPMYLPDIRKVSRKCTAMDCANSALIKVVVNSNRSTGGRGIESSFLTIENMQYDKEFNAAKLLSPQPKSHKSKISVWVASLDPDDCMFTSWGEYLHLATNRPNYNTDGKENWLFPEVATAPNPTGKISGWLKEYTGDPEASAGGIRPGVANTLAKHMPAEFIVVVTGHDMRHVSALYEYIDCNVAQLMPGARVLAGWKPPEWGQLGGDGPKHAHLDYLEQAHGVNKEALDKMIDDMFHIHDHSPPHMQSEKWQPGDRCSAAEKSLLISKRARIRDVIKACFASLIMHYNARMDQGKMRSVCIRLQNLVAQYYPTSSPETTLRKWSETLHTRFIIDNNHLIDPTIMSPQVV